MAEGVDVKAAELPWNPVDAMPKPGAMVVARRTLKAWENDRERGTNGLVVHEGAVGLVLQVWAEGKQVRIRLLIKDAVVLFSHPHHCVWLNWAYGEGLAT